MSKEKKVALFNKGDRSFQTTEGVIAPKEVLEVSATLGKKLLKAYGKELIEGGVPSEKSDDKAVAALEAKVEDLEAIVADKDAAIAEKEGEIEVLKEDASAKDDEIKELKDQVEEYEKLLNATTEADKKDKK